MTNNNTITRTIVTVVITLIIAAGSAIFVSSVKAGAVSYKGSAQGNASSKIEKLTIADKTTKMNEFAKAYYFKAAGKTTKGYDWTYKSDTNNIKVKCKYDSTTHKYTFKMVGTSYGLNHFTLKYKQSDKTWVSVKMNLFVDKDKYIMRTA